MMAREYSSLELWIQFGIFLFLNTLRISWESPSITNFLIPISLLRVKPSIKDYNWAKLLDIEPKGLEHLVRHDPLFEQIIHPKTIGPSLPLKAP